MAAAVVKKVLRIKDWGLGKTIPSPQFFLLSAEYSIYRFDITSRATFRVCSISSSVWAIEVNPASN